jgi:polyhydroxybutyrate depolymerase
MLWSLPLTLLLACGPPCGEGGPCRVDGGEYLAVPPDDWDGESTLPTVIYFHGYNSSAQAQVGRKISRQLRAEGWLTIYPDGKQNTWAHVGSPSQARDEIAFVSAVLDDVEQRYPVGIVASSGFSQGSSMAWDAACYLPDRFDLLWGASGSFWEPEPARCDGPVAVRHTHATDDTVMPLEGRPIGSYHQGSVEEGFAAWRTTNGCADEPDAIEVRGPETCEVWSSCTSGLPVERCLYEGGHKRPDGWVARMLEFTEGAL